MAVARYMTKGDRENIVRLCSVEGTLDVIVKEMAQHERPKEWLRALRMAHTWAGKANQLMADECSDDELKKLWKYFEKYEIKIMPTHEAKQIIDQESLTTVSADGLNDMAEAVLSVKCDGCQITDHMSCKYRKALMGAGIPAWEDPVDGCQYKYESRETKEFYEMIGDKN